MSVEELVLEKLRKLDSDQQQQALAYLDSLPASQQTANAQPSLFGKKLRDEIIASGIPLLNDEELEREIAERRGSRNTDELDILQKW